MANTAKRTYEDLLAGRGLKVGDQVLCSYRMPSPNQWWVAPMWVGVIEPVGTDKATWNGHCSEEDYCVQLTCVKVRYLGANGLAGHTQHDSLANINQLHFGVEAESPWFSSEDGLEDLYRFAARAGFGDRYKIELESLGRL
jgi:hypothetical protein